MGAVPAPRPRLGNAGAAVGIAGAAAGLLGTAYLGMAPLAVAAGLAALLWAAVTHRFFLRWRVMLIAVVLIVLFIPMGRYALPGSLPVQLEPYRVRVALVTVTPLTCTGSSSA